LDFSLVSGYKQNSKNQKRIISDDDDEVDTIAIIDTAPMNLTQNIIQDKGLFNNIEYQEQLTIIVS
jgi:hypothetical protein